jgi:hypothetical protein
MREPGCPKIKASAGAFPIASKHFLDPKRVHDLRHISGNGTNAKDFAWYARFTQAQRCRHEDLDLPAFGLNLTALARVAKMVRLRSTNCDRSSCLDSMMLVGKATNSCPWPFGRSGVP